MKTLAKTTASAALAIGLAATGASAQDTVELSMATPWAGGHWLEIGANSYAENVADLTEGRVTINVFPAGALGPALDVTEKAITETCAFVCAFDQSRNIRQHEFAAVDADDAELRMQGRERIVRDLRFRRADHGEECGFACIG